jgi:hypothetical protein
MTDATSNVEHDSISFGADTGVPVFDGAAEVIELLRILVRRPSFGETPEREWGKRRRRYHRGIPMVCLIRDANQAVLLPELAKYLANARPGRIPHVLYRYPTGKADGTVTQTASEKSEQTVVHQEGKDVEAIRAVLFELSKKLAASINTRDGKIRFRRFWLAHWLMSQDLDGEGIESDAVLRRRLRDRDLLRQQFTWLLSDPATELTNTAPVPRWASSLLRLVPPIWFLAKIKGLLPGVGAEYRWFLRQPYLAPRDPGTFLGFAERLTIGMRDQENSEQLLRLLINAFLTDLRSAYRWFPWAAKRRTYIVILLDGITRANGGYRLLKLINDVRNDTGAFDPLLIISGSQKAPPDSIKPQDSSVSKFMWLAARSRRAYEAWCNRLSTASRARTPTAWYLPILVPSTLVPSTFVKPGQVNGETAALVETSVYDSNRQDIESIPVFTIDPPPVWSRRWVTMLAVFFLVCAGGYPVYDMYRGRVLAGEHWEQQHCGLDRGVPNAERLLTINDECIGVSANGFHFQATDSALSKVEDKIAEQDHRAEVIHELNPRRPYLSIVYVAALSSTAQPLGELVSQRESLEGIAVAQVHQLEKNGENDPVVRILVANAGMLMKHGVKVAEMLKQMIVDDPSIVGVVGLDQSRQPTINTIVALSQAGLPMVASTLTADELTTYSPMYFSVAPQNKRQATVAAKYVREILTRPSPGRVAIAPKVRIIYSADSADNYSKSLRNDVYESFQDLGFEVDERTFVPTSAPESPPPARTPGPRAISREICGYDGLVFFAGRSEDFEVMLSGINDHCKSRPPAILAGNFVSRYVADPRLRQRYMAIPFDYLSFTVGTPSCDRNSNFYSTLAQLFPQECEGGRDPSLAGHAALAYDAVFCVINAVEYLRENDRSLPITPATVWYGLSGIHGAAAIDGEGGKIDFGGIFNQQVPLDKLVAILRVDGPGWPNERGSCGQSGTHSSSPWCLPDPKIPASTAAHRSGPR